MNATEIKDELLSTGEALALLGEGRNYLRKLIAAGAINKIKPAPDMHPRYRKSEILALLNGQPNQQPPAKRPGGQETKGKA